MTCLSLLYTNAQSLPNKINELSGIAADLKPDLIFVTETWCNDNIDSSLLKLAGYDLNTDLRRDREDTQQGIGGGLLVYTKPGIYVLCYDNPVSNSRFNQYSAFQIVGLREKWTVYLIYRPPSSTLENNERLMDLITTTGPNTIMIGDFNCPGVDWKELTADSARGRALLDACTSSGLEQLVSFPTHIKGNVLDLVLTNNPGKILTVCAQGRLGKSDHEMLLVELEVGQRNVKEKEFTRNWRRANWEAMREELSERDWRTELNCLNTEEAWCTFKYSVESAVEKYVPLREIRQADRPPWMTVSLLQEIRQKRRLWAKYKRSPTDQNKESYSRAEKTIHKKIKKAKKNYEQGLSKDKTDSKKFYSYMRSKTGNRVDVGPLKVDGTTVADSKGMADKLNEYFGSVFQQENVASVPKATEMITGSKCRGVNFRPSVVKKAIRQLKPNSAPGPDGITPRVLQELVNEVAEPLGLIFQKSLAEGAVPDDWRTANVTPIFKKGSKSSPSNYRPVSLTSVPGKVMERVIKESLMLHLDRNKLLRHSQHGFVPKKSCTTNLLEYLEKVTQAVDEGKAVDVVYLDFAKAFDLVPRQRLMAKLKAHGIDGELLRWISSWLQNRRQRVVLNGSSSGWVAVTSGVPQGSILGPVLFAIFINDLDERVESIVDILLKFADDTKVGKVISGEEDRKKLQEALDQLWRWADRWEMRFNVEKCHVLHLGRHNPRHKYTMNGIQLEVSEKEKDIGVIISENLKPTTHCEKAARTAMAVLHQILRAFSYRDRTVLPRIYAQYVRPHLEFAVQAWAPWQRGEIELLENVQRKMVREVVGLQGITYEERLVELGMDTLEKRRQDQDLVQVFKILKNVDSVNKETWFKQVPEERSHKTRATEGGHNIVRVNSKLEVRRNFFSQRVAEKWNALPLNLKSCKSVKEFRALLMKTQHQ